MIVRFKYANVIVISEVCQLIDQSFSFRVRDVISDSPVEHFNALQLTMGTDQHGELKSMAIMAYKRNLEELRAENKEA